MELWCQGSSPDSHLLYTILLFQQPRSFSCFAVIGSTWLQRFFLWDKEDFSSCLVCLYYHVTTLTPPKYSTVSLVFLQWCREFPPDTINSYFCNMGLRNRQSYQDKHIFFSTTTCHEWQYLLTIGNAMQILAKSLNFCLNKYHVSALGYVFMPNHIHLILYFSEGSKRIDFMRDFKKFTSTKIRQEIEAHQPEKLANLVYQKDNQIFKVWQDRFDELYLASRELLVIKLNYIHANPLQDHWNLAKRPENYFYSSAMFYEQGIPNAVILNHYMDFT